MGSQHSLSVAEGYVIEESGNPRITVVKQAVRLHGNGIVLPDKYIAVGFQRILLLIKEGAVAFHRGIFVLERTVDDPASAFLSHQVVRVQDTDGSRAILGLQQTG